MLRIIVARTEGASANPSARIIIIIMIWWTNIAWLSQARPARRITVDDVSRDRNPATDRHPTLERRRNMFHMRRAGREDRLL